MSASAEQPADTVTATFMFADIAGFTALTEAHGDEAAANLVAEFAASVKQELPSYSGRHIKTIGDALMLLVPDPGEAVQFALRIAHELMRGHGAPAVRVGLHHGPALEREGDYFGATVNLAARISAVATGGEVLISGHAAALAPAPDGVVYESRGRHELRNISSPVELFAALPAAEYEGGSLATDVVCQMAVDPQRAPGRLVHEDVAYHFCSLTCAAEFARKPDRFARGVSALHQR